MIVLAHGLGGRSDLPVPLWMALYGGAAALIISFLALGILWAEPRLRGSSAGFPLPRVFRQVADSRVSRGVLRGFGVLGFLLVVVTLVAGDQSVVDNPAPTWFYVWFWVGLVPASLAFGPVWKLLNPLRALAAALSLTNGDEDLPFEEEDLDEDEVADEEKESQGARVSDQQPAYPSRLGYTPAGIWLLAFLWLELVFDRGSEPLVIAIFILAYSAFNVAGGIRYGQPWFDHADGFEVYSTLISKLSPFGRRSDGTLVVRNPLNGLDAIEPRKGLVFFVCVVLGSTAFDGLTRTKWWGSISEFSSSYAYYLGIGTVGLLASVGLVYVIYLAATRTVVGLTDESQAQTLDKRFIHSLIPIAIGYTIAHYFSLLVFQGQAGYILASDPFSRGWDLFGTADWRIDYKAVSVFTIAWVQVASIVGGHILGVIAAHDRAVRLFADGAKTKAQYPLLAAMVAFTLGGIFLLVGT
ncbi:MAG TPA: hypothetical protein VNA87_05180 [Actinomycetota bacterium]|nr:hypothetical protein [Actinomycetota bacterium]